MQQSELVTINSSLRTQDLVSSYPSYASPTTKPVSIAREVVLSSDHIVASTVLQNIALAHGRRLIDQRCSDIDTVLMGLIVSHCCFPTRLFCSLIQYKNQHVRNPGEDGERQRAHKGVTNRSALSSHLHIVRMSDDMTER